MKIVQIVFGQRRNQGETVDDFHIGIFAGNFPDVFAETDQNRDLFQHVAAPERRDAQDRNLIPINTDFSIAV